MTSICADVLIVGGGMVGASLACAISKRCTGQELKIVVCERHLPVSGEAYEDLQPSFDARSTALSISSERFFQELGLWQMLSGVSEAIKRIHVSERGCFGSTLLDHQEQGMDALGYVVENQALGKALYKGLESGAGITVLAPAAVEKITPFRDSISAELKIGEKAATIKSRLLVVADGANSSSCRALGIETDSTSYEQLALITNISHGRPHSGIAYERFVGDGSLAMLPLIAAAGAENRSALVWARPVEEAERLKSLSDAAFLGQLQEDFGYRLGRLKRTAERHTYQLALSRVREQFRARTVIMGNAAHSIHPVAGQGFNLSLRDVASLGELVAEQIRAGRDPGDTAVLEAYQHRQKQDQDLTTSFSDLLPRLFSLPELPMVMARGIGMVGLELMPPAKRAFVRQATGLGAGAGRDIL